MWPQVADALAEEAEELLAQVEVDVQAVLLPPGLGLGCDALADLQRELAQAVVQRADIAQADDDAAFVH